MNKKITSLTLLQKQRMPQTKKQKNYLISEQEIEQMNQL